MKKSKIYSLKCIVKIFAGYILLFAIIFCIISFLVECYFTIDIFAYYRNSIRPALVAPFITTGSFLLSLAPLIIITLKEKFIDSDEYKKKYELSVNMFGNTDSIYTPIINIGRLICVSMLFCYISSLLQYTLGVVEYDLLTLFIISISSATMALVIFLIINIINILSDYLNQLK